MHENTAGTDKANVLLLKNKNSNKKQLIFVTEGRIFSFKLRYLHDLPVGLPAPATSHHGQDHTVAATLSLYNVKNRTIRPEDEL